MNQRIALGLTLLAGVAIGVTAIQGLHAQAKPPAYVVIPMCLLFPLPFAQPKVYRSRSCH
jgi:hypothetical protein